MADHDLDLFRSEMGDVKPLAPDNRVTARAQSAPSPAQLARREAAVRERLKDPNPLTLPEQVAEIGPHDIVGHRKNGVQEGVYRKLRLGKYEIQAKLDLHRITLTDGRKMVHDMLTEAHQRGLRTLLITHGKGMHSPQPARMKSYVMHWLAESDLVLAWHSARPEHGGAGATYVLVRKSTEASLRTREVYAERSRRQRGG